MIKKILIIGFIALSNAAFCQNNLRMLPCEASSSCDKNTLYDEFNSNVKNFNYTSINFEHLTSCSPTHNFGLYIGAIYYSFPKIYSEGLRGGFNFMFGRYSNLFEFGLGGTYLYISRYYNSEGATEHDLPYAGLNGNIGFRHQNADGGLFYKIDFTPMLSVLNYKQIPIIASNAFILMGGVSIGWTFK